MALGEMSDKTVKVYIERLDNMNINNQSFNNVNGSVNNIENGNAYNTTNINSPDADDIMEMMKKITEYINLS